MIDSQINFQMGVHVRDNRVYLVVPIREMST